MMERPLQATIKLLSQTQIDADGDIKKSFVRDVWPKLEGEYGKMKDIVVKFAHDLFARRGIKCRIDSRIKTAESIKLSLQRREDHRIRVDKGHPYESFEDIFEAIHDLVGTKVILDFLDDDDHERAVQCIKENFHVVGQPTVFSTDRNVYEHWKALFGAYQTHNYRVMIKHDGSVNQLSFCSEVLFEIQLTNVAEDLYNKLAHNLLYKTPAGSRTREQEIILDLSHGLSLCFGLTLMFMKNLLDPTGNPTPGASGSATEPRTPQGVVDDGKAFQKSLISKMKTSEGDPTNASNFNFSLPGHCLTTIQDLRNWLTEKLDGILPTGNRLVSVAENHLQVAKECRDLAQEQRQWTMSAEEQRCHQAFYLTTGVDRPADYTWYKDRVQDRVEGTCQWFLGQQRYKDWLDQESGLLLVSADPGCGKSVLAKYLIDHGLPRSAAIYYYFFKDQDQCTINQALCALLHQLFAHQRRLIQHAMASYREKGKRLKDAAASTLWEILQKAVKDQDAQPMIIVLDALDECGPSDLGDLLKLIRELFRGSGRSAATKIRFLLTTRPYSRVIELFNQSFVHIRIPGEDESEAISHEVDAVIQVRVQELARTKHLPTNVQDALLDRLLRIQHRTYLWAYLLFDYLQFQDFKRTEKGLLSLIDSLPKNFYEAYEKILSKSGKRETVRKALSITLVARRPLTITEMNFAMGTDLSSRLLDDLDLEDDEHFKANLRSWCGLFLAVDHGKVYFLHQTAREFLVADISDGSPYITHSTSSWFHSITEKDAHRVLAEACIAYLNLIKSDLDFLTVPNDNDTSSIDSNGWPVPPHDMKYAFIRYSIDSWVHHTDVADMADDESLFSSLLGLYTSDPRARALYFDESDFDERLWKRSCTNLSLASFFGHTSIVRHSLRTELNDINAQNGDAGGTALIMAAGKGHLDIIHLILETGLADINLGNGIGMAALARAVSGGHEKVVQLLSATAKINSRDRYGYTPLIWAAMQGYTTIVELLLGTGQADINLQSQPGYAPLFQAAENGHKTIVELALEMGQAEINSQTKYRHTDLIRAAMEGPTTTFELLRGTRQADIFAQARAGYTALIQATAKGHTTIVELLLGTGQADINAQTQAGYTALIQAAENGHTTIVELLLGTGQADINAQTQAGYTALIRATAKGHTTIVELLLGTGQAEINLQDQYGYTALIRAAENGHTTIVELLLATGQADTKLQSTCVFKSIMAGNSLPEDLSGTALMWAEMNGHDAVVKLLLGTGQSRCPPTR